MCVHVFVTLFGATSHKFRRQKAFLCGKIYEDTKGSLEICTLHWQIDKCY